MSAPTDTDRERARETLEEDACTNRIFGFCMDGVIPEWAAEQVDELHRQELARLRAMLRSAMCLIHGLYCPSCKAQGREMAAPGKCCRDADCDAGWYGIGCDDLAGWDCYRIAELEGVGNHVIERRLREAGVTIRTNASSHIQRLKAIARKISKKKRPPEEPGNLVELRDGKVLE